MLKNFVLYKNKILMTYDHSFLLGYCVGIVVGIGLCRLHDYVFKVEKVNASILPDFGSMKNLKKILEKDSAPVLETVEHPDTAEPNTDEAAQDAQPDADVAEEAKEAVVQAQEALEAAQGAAEDSQAVEASQAVQSEDCKEVQTVEALDALKEGKVLEESQAVQEAVKPKEPQEDGLHYSYYM